MTVQGPVKKQQPDGLSHRGTPPPSTAPETVEHPSGSGWEHPPWSNRNRPAAAAGHESAHRQCTTARRMRTGHEPSPRQTHGGWSRPGPDPKGGGGGGGRAPLTRKRHIPPHSAQPQHTNDWAPRTRKRHQQEHRPQRPTERSDPTQHAKGRTGDCPGPRQETTTRRTVTQGDPPPLYSP